MEEIVLSGLKLFAAFLLDALYGLFVAAEFAYTKLKSTRVEVIVWEDKASADFIEETTQSFDAYLSGRKVDISRSQPLRERHVDRDHHERQDDAYDQQLPQNLALPYGCTGSCSWRA